MALFNTDACNAFIRAPRLWIWDAIHANATPLRRRQNTQTPFPKKPLVYAFQFGIHCRVFLYSLPNKEHPITL